MKKNIVLIAFLFTFSNLFCLTQSINDDSVKAYRTALQNYDDHNYGKALKQCEDAITFRKSISENYIKVLNNSLSAKKVQNAGDSIYSIKQVLTERGETESLSIIDYFLNKKGEDYFHDSITELLSYINSTKDYPEAYKLLGDIYKMEGEYTFAENYYLQALEHADALDIPNEKYDIIYTLAEISKINQDYDKMELRYLSILSSDTFYKDKTLNNAMLYTIKNDKKNSVEKLFKLYRTDNIYCLKAYKELSEYYYSIGEKEKSLNFCVLACISSVSKINDILSIRNINYNYNSLSEFLQETALYSDLVEWGNENSVWESFNNLARITKELGYKNFSRDLLINLAKFCPESYWQKESVLQLERF